MDNIEEIRSQFPALRQTVYGKPLIYFDNAATSQRPQRVLDMVYVPVYPTLSDADFEFIFNNSDCEAIFIGGEKIYQKVLPIIAKMEKPAKVYMIDDTDDGRACLKDIIELGDREEETYSPVIENNKKTIDTHDWVTMIYTSGTTGEPKGVMRGILACLFLYRNLCGVPSPVLGRQGDKGDGACLRQLEQAFIHS